VIGQIITIFNVIANSYFENKMNHWETFQQHKIDPTLFVICFLKRSLLLYYLNLTTEPVWTLIIISYHK